MRIVTVQVAYVVDAVLRAAVETGAPNGNSDGNNPTGKRAGRGSWSPLW